MRYPLRSHLRRSVSLCCTLLTVLGVAVLSLIPLRIAGHRLAAWLIVGYARLMLRLYNVRVHCAEPELLKHHHGLVIINHLSYLDAMSLLSLGPMRCLAAAELRRYPLVGRLSDALGAVYVQRDNKASRAESRRRVAEALRREPSQQLVIAAEGKLGPGDQLLPFRHGAFAIALEHELPILLCAIQYTPLEPAVWHGGRGETLGQAMLRLGALHEPMHVELSIVESIEPQAEDTAQALAEYSHQIIRGTLGL